jgi:hypothetical protein
MSMGTRKCDRQPAMWVTATNLPTAASHPFYRRLNQLLREHGFDAFVEPRLALSPTLRERLRFVNEPAVVAPH